MTKANRIVKYIDNNPRTVSLYSFLPQLFKYFQNLMVAHFAKDKSDRGIAGELGLSSPWSAKYYLDGMRYYNAVKTMAIIRKIRVTDAKIKGIDNTNTSPGDLMNGFSRLYFVPRLRGIFFALICWKTIKSPIFHPFKTSIFGGFAHVGR